MTSSLLANALLTYVLFKHHLLTEKDIGICETPCKTCAVV
jgi:hypothetical protein